MDNVYQIPKEVIQHIQKELIKHPIGDGVRRAKFILRNMNLNKQALERIKHDFKNISDRTQYELAGGELMLQFIERVLNSETVNNDISKEVRRDSTVDVNSALHAQQNPRLET